MPTKRIYRPVLFNPRTPRCIRFAGFVEKAAAPGSRDGRELSAMICWVSAIEAARRAGAITKESAAQLNLDADLNNPERFVPTSAYTIRTKNDWESVPAGCFVALLGNGFSEGQGRLLSHVMVTLGNGRAVGSNNGPIGGSPAWEIIDLGEKLTWGGEFAYYDGRSFEVRVRDIEDQATPSCTIQ